MSTPRTLEHPDVVELNLDAVLSALADPMRRRIVVQLAHGCEDQACIAFALPVGRSTATHHFRVLRLAGIIEQRYQGTAILNSLRASCLQERFPGLLDAIVGAEAPEAPEA